MAYDTTQFSVRRGGRRREGDYKQYIATIYKTRSETQNNNTECSLGKLDGRILAKLSIWLGMKTNAKQTNYHFQLDQAGAAGVSVGEGKWRMTKPRGKIFGDLL